MELDLFYNGSKKTYIVSKYIKKFIIPLDRVKNILKESNNYELMKLDRKGKIFNCIFMTDETDLSAVVDIREIRNGVSFLAKRKDAAGFSRMVLGADYTKVPKGILTVILKECDKEYISGYYLNSFWGYPVSAEPFGKFDDIKAYHSSKEFWETHMYRAEDLEIEWDTVLMDRVLSKAEIEMFYKNKVKLSYIGKADLLKNYKLVEIDPNHKYYAYRGYYVE